MKPLRSILAILSVALGVAIGACFLPENPYQRWQLLDGTIHAKARWIYERIHFDSSPIDVVFVGPSRIGAGVNAPRLGHALAARGLPANVVNFSLPETGRNINYAIVEEMLKEKRPKLLVIGVMEKPSRFGHPAFKYIAERGLIVDPGYLGNLDYLPNLAYLPYRQMRLFVADIAPDGDGLAKAFTPAGYRGASIDTTGDIVLPGGAIKHGEEPASPAELRRGVRKLEAGAHPPFLPESLGDIEFGDERYYIRDIVRLARADNVRIAFLFIPYYTGTSQLQEQQFYQRFGPVWNAGFLSTHAELFADYAHLTRNGANRLTDWLVDPVSTMLAPQGSQR